eukprot:CAMPEP_0113686684 /NCGR_PEP_ID=MMETSP0038_2-20120614/15440_1 /TAXON_ID=2898 /ORGANISM="Cryptomonas paramecium" /LENGTH=62 /DNA_ID=CAMNT_0000607061 /DNA_START=501 /DNA_END=687 /DNA_ORIENTATION=+ /assembly_acc=CAM_ASM_000170
MKVHKVDTITDALDETSLSTELSGLVGGGGAVFWAEMEGRAAVTSFRFNELEAYTELDKAGL